MTIKQLNINVIQDGYTLSIPQILKKKCKRRKKKEIEKIESSIIKAKYKQTEIIHISSTYKKQTTKTPLLLCSWKSTDIKSGGEGTEQRTKTSRSSVGNIIELVLDRGVHGGLLGEAHRHGVVGDGAVVASCPLGPGGEGSSDWRRNAIDSDRRVVVGLGAGGEGGLHLGRHGDGAVEGGLDDGDGGIGGNGHRHGHSARRGPEGRATGVAGHLGGHGGVLDEPVELLDVGHRLGDGDLLGRGMDS